MHGTRGAHGMCRLVYLCGWLSKGFSEVLSWACKLGAETTDISGSSTVLQYISLCKYCFFFFFNRLKACSNPVSSKSLSPFFPAPLFSFSYIDNSHNISTFSIIIIFIVVTCDQ